MILKKEINSMNKISRTLEIILAALFIVFFVTITNAQSKYYLGKASIKTAYGYLFVCNTEDRSFTFEIKGKDVKAMENDNNPAFMVDGKVLQIVTADTKLFITDKKSRSVEEILDLHKVWESTYLEESFGANLKLESEPVSIKDFKALFWGFKREKLNQDFSGDYFLTTLIGKNLLALSFPLRPDQPVGDCKKYFISTMETLKISVEKLAEEIGLRTPNKGLNSQE